MKSLHALAVAAIISFAPLHNAVARDVGDIYTQCGLGGLIAPRTPALAVTTNIIWDLGTTASSSDISSPESCKGSSAKAAALIYRAYPSLERELAQGRGDNVDALLSLANCQDGARAELTAALRSSLAATVNAPGYSSKSRVDQARSLNESFTGQVEGAFAQSCNLG